LAQGSDSWEIQEVVAVAAEHYREAVRGADPRDVHQAGEVAGNVWSRYGRPDMSVTVITAITNALEAGYIMALRDIRAGKLER
jgi:hypothetical protein